MATVYDIVGWALLLAVGAGVAGLLAMALAAPLALLWGYLGLPLPRSGERVRQSLHRPQISPELRRAVLKRDSYSCVICGSRSNLELDHEVPISRGGATSYENLRVLCHQHNLEKGAT